MATAFVFPGQGSQAVGMGLALANAYPQARRVFEEVDDALAEKLTTIMWEGPADTLTLTHNAQPALLAVSIAALRVLEAEAGLNLAGDAAFVAGHSLGEYSALTAAGALRLADAARLVRLRGQAMQKAVPVGVGAMAALLGLEFDDAVAVASAAAEGQICQAANDNGGGQVVISGEKAAVERAVELAKIARRQAGDDASGLRAIPLQADAAGGRRHGAGAGGGCHQGARRCGCCQRDCDAGEGTTGDPGAPGRAGDRNRALARVGHLHGRPRSQNIL